ncbi:hypothetical protein DFP72DRAFT_911976 [Ephemerocybe angulata]|uniref:F-box domain-containing protein n=1 Tax=Ephemerocybe angulata TaxID=980116 RepID=A0A8H6HQ60_9AGAR|nr:hypothetical protein DFP72DRAFT_911976 [Tulosesus angulatus]
MAFHLGSTLLKQATETLTNLSMTWPGAQDAIAQKTWSPFLWAPSGWVASLLFSVRASSSKQVLDATGGTAKYVEEIGNQETPMIISTEPQLAVLEDSRSPDLNFPHEAPIIPTTVDSHPTMEHKEPFRPDASSDSSSDKPSVDYAQSEIICEATSLPNANTQVTQDPVVEESAVLTSRRRVTKDHEPPVPRALNLNDLPTEILSRIFSLYLDDPVISPEQKAKRAPISLCPGATVSPVDLTWICRRWRTIAESQSTLWSRVYIDIPRDKDILLLTQWLARSRNTPLDLSVVIKKNRKSAARKTVELVMQQSHRWRTIFFNLHNSIENVATSSFTKLPVLLEDSKIDLYEWSATSTINFCEKLYSAPNLRKVRWGYEVSGYWSLYGGSAWTVHSLMFLSLKTAKADQLLPFLSGSANLQHLEIGYLEERGPKTDITLPSLTSLVVKKIDFPGVLSSFHLPALTTLKLGQDFFVNYMTGAWMDFKKPLFQMIEQSQPGLRSFTVSWDFTYHMEDDERLMLGILREMKGLQHLSLGTPASDITLQALTFSNEPWDLYPLLPNLSQVHFADCQSSDGVLAEMITSRNGCVKGVSVMFPLGACHSVDRERLSSLPSIKVNLQDALDRAVQGYGFF